MAIESIFGADCLPYISLPTMDVSPTIYDSGFSINFHSSLQKSIAKIINKVFGIIEIIRLQAFGCVGGHAKCIYTF